MTPEQAAKINQQNQKGIRHLERCYMTKRRRKTHIALEEIDFNWDADEVKEFREMWKAGISVIEMATHFDRPNLEVALLVIDQAERNRIDLRKTGWEGITLEEAEKKKSSNSRGRKEGL